MSVAANDSVNLYSFDDGIKMLAADGITGAHVPFYTYDNKYIHDKAIGVYCYWKRKGIAFKEGEMPMIMKGSWELERRPFRHYTEVLIDRFISFYKLNVFSRHDADIVSKRLRKLIFESSKKKRACHDRAQDKGISLFQEAHSTTQCYLLGKRIVVDTIKMPVMRSILRQQRKLERVINNNGDSQKWQRLIQQEI